MSKKSDKKELEDIEIDLVLEAIRRRYDYDFRDYARASLKRRLRSCSEKEGKDHISDLISSVLHEEHFVNKILMDVSVTVTEFFRDPEVHHYLRNHVIPKLQTYPFIKIWHAGCATGEEVYSMAIMLEEAGLLDRACIYATDFNKNSLYLAKQGIYDEEKLEANEALYKKSGGPKKLKDYFQCKYGSAKVKEHLKKNITFAHHNLVKDGVFAEMNLILCRNVLIYFNNDLQNSVLEKFHQSLCHRGFLCLGTRERLEGSSVSEQFEALAKDEKIYRRK